MSDELNEGIWNSSSIIYQQDPNNERLRTSIGITNIKFYGKVIKFYVNDESIDNTLPIEISLLNFASIISKDNISLFYSFPVEVNILEEGDLNLSYKIILVLTSIALFLSGLFNPASFLNPALFLQEVLIFSLIEVNFSEEIIQFLDNTSGLNLLNHVSYLTPNILRFNRTCSLSARVRRRYSCSSIYNNFYDFLLLILIFSLRLIDKGVIRDKIKVSYKKTVFKMIEDMTSLLIMRIFLGFIPLFSDISHSLSDIVVFLELTCLIFSVVLLVVVKAASIDPKESFKESVIKMISNYSTKFIPISILLSFQKTSSSVFICILINIERIGCLAVPFVKR